MDTIIIGIEIVLVLLFLAVTCVNVHTDILLHKLMAKLDEHIENHDQY